MIPWCTSDVRSDHRASRASNVSRLTKGMPGLKAVGGIFQTRGVRDAVVVYNNFDWEHKSDKVIYLRRYLLHGG